MNTIRSRAARVLQRIWRFCWPVPAWVFGITYLLLIPVFALKYTHIAHGFYQSNIKVENEYSNEGDAVLDGLCDAIATHLLRQAGTDLGAPHASEVKTNVGNWSFRPQSDIFCSRLRLIDDDRVQFTVTINLQGPAPPYQVRITAITAPEEVSGTYTEAGGTNLLDRRVDITVEEQYFLYRLQADAVAHAVFDYGEGRHFVVPVIVVSGGFDGIVFHHFIRESNGFTSDASDNFDRMLYFSAVTITTLGYGDIVPVASEARVWVTAEAVLGVVLIGFFLNAIARERKRTPGGL